MPFGCSKTLSKILKGFLIDFGKIISLSHFSEVLYFQNHHYHYHHYNFCVVVVLKLQNLGKMTQTDDFPKSDEESFENFRYGFGTPKGHTFNS